MTLDKLKVIKSLVYPYRRESFRMLFLLILAALAETIGLSAIVPVLSIVIEGGVGSDSMSTLFATIFQKIQFESQLVAVMVLFVFLIAIKAFLQVLSKHVSSELTWRMNADWANALQRKFLEAPYGYILGQKQGVLVHSAVTEPYWAAKSIGVCIEFISKVVLSLFLYVALLATQWKITLVITVIGVLAAVPLRIINRKKTSSVSKEHQELQKQQMALSSEAFAAARLIKTFSLEDKMISRFRAMNDRLMEIRVSHDFLSVLPTPAGELFLVIGMALGVIGISYFGNGDLKSHLPFIGMLLIVSRQLINSLSVLANNWMRIQFFFPSMDMVAKALVSTPSDPHLQTGKEFERLNDDIRFVGVGFSYGSNKKILTDANFVFPKGKMTAIIGPSGVGKSTIGDLLLGLVQPEEGQILINGVSLVEYSRNSWRKKVGFVSQETTVFHASIAENISCWDPTISEQKIESVARLAQIHDFFASLPEGYKTVVGERGMRLSGGQRQRLAIARALARDPEILVFDEATSALDTESERAVQDAIDGLSGESLTIVVITHRLSTIANAAITFDLGK